MNRKQTKAFKPIKPKNKIARTSELNLPKYSNVVANKKENKKITKNSNSPRII